MMRWLLLASPPSTWCLPRGESCDKYGLRLGGYPVWSDVVRHVELTNVRMELGICHIWIEDVFVFVRALLRTLLYSYDFTRKLYYGKNEQYDERTLCGGVEWIRMRYYLFSPTWLYVPNSLILLNDHFKGECNKIWKYMAILMCGRDKLSSDLLGR